MEKHNTQPIKMCLGKGWQCNSLDTFNMHHSNYINNISVQKCMHKKYYKIQQPSAISYSQLHVYLCLPRKVNQSSNVFHQLQWKKFTITAIGWSH